MWVMAQSTYVYKYAYIRACKQYNGKSNQIKSDGGSDQNFHGDIMVYVQLKYGQLFDVSKPKSLSNLILLLLLAIIRYNYYLIT